MNADRKRIILKNGGQQGRHESAYSDGNPYSDNPEPEFFELIGRILRKKRVIFIAALSVMVLSALIVLLMPNLYTSQCSILPTGNTDKFAELRQLAGMGGFSSIDKNSSELYPVILQSQTIQDNVVMATYSFEHQGKRIEKSFSDYCDSENMDILRRKLASMTRIATDNKTGVIYLFLESRYPGFSRAVLNKYLSELEHFNRYRRLSAAKENVQYLKTELTKVKEQLTAAENELEAFQMANRDWDATSDPETKMTLARLWREIEMKTKMYTLLMEQFELARLEQQKDTPIVRILDAPTLPSMKSAPRRLMTVLLAGILTMLAMTSVLMIIENIKLRCLKTNNNSLEYLRQSVTEAFPRTGTTINRIRNRFTRHDHVPVENVEVNK
jgi:uncharacterized protein involved in exopolysaccharide biosynthesis